MLDMEVESCFGMKEVKEATSILILIFIHLEVNNSKSLVILTRLILVIIDL
jgi:hypothetical protein